jgi:hypothetical protein
VEAWAPVLGRPLTSSPFATSREASEHRNVCHPNVVLRLRQRGQVGCGARPQETSQPSKIDLQAEPGRAYVDLSHHPSLHRLRRSWSARFFPGQPIAVSQSEMRDLENRIFFKAPGPSAEFREVHFCRSWYSQTKLPISATQLRRRETSGAWRNKRSSIQIEKRL